MFLAWLATNNFSLGFSLFQKPPWTSKRQFCWKQRGYLKDPVGRESKQRCQHVITHCRNVILNLLTRGYWAEAIVPIVTIMHQDNIDNNGYNKLLFSQINASPWNDRGMLQGQVSSIYFRAIKKARKQYQETLCYCKMRQDLVSIAR